ncbi:MAG: hypothetical protein ACSHWQ_00045 [Spongiibacteraceae bacterium]
MPTTLTFDSADSAPEELRDHLAESDGKFTVMVHAEPEVSNLQSALQAERQANRDSKKRLSGVTDLEAQLQQLQSENESLAAQGGDADKWQAKVDQLNTQHQTEIAKRDEKVNGIYGKVKTERRNAEIAKAVAEADGLPGLDAVIGGAVDVEIDDDGNVQTLVKGADGNPLVDTTGNYLSVSDYAKNLKDKMPHLFKGTTASGSGSRTQGSPAPSGKKRSEMTVGEKTAYVGKHGQDAYLKLQP